MAEWFRSTRVQRLVNYLLSLKFWLPIVGLGLAFWVIGADPNPAAVLVKAALVFLTFISLALGISFEDGLSGRR